MQLKCTNYIKQSKQLNLLKEHVDFRSCFPKGTKKNLWFHLESLLMYSTQHLMMHSFLKLSQSNFELKKSENTVKSLKMHGCSLLRAVMQICIGQTNFSLKQVLFQVPPIICVLCFILPPSSLELQVHSPNGLWLLGKWKLEKSLSPVDFSSTPKKFDKQASSLWNDFTGNNNCSIHSRTTVHFSSPCAGL